MIRSSPRASFVPHSSNAIGASERGEALLDRPAARQGDDLAIVTHEERTVSRRRGGAADIGIERQQPLRVTARGKRGHLLEAGGTQAYFGNPAVASSEEGERLLATLAEIIVQSYLEALEQR